jgi:SAM-dependent methyltransferase
LEGEFYQYMHSLGQVDAEANRRTLEFYVSYFAHCQYVLDVGCGEGQFIAALLAQGIKASGVDTDTHMVRTCREKGLDIVEADLFEYLPQHKDEFDGILGSNVIEHFSMQDTLQFLGTAFDALRPGGILLLATPNPESLIVHLYEFWRDATHTRLYNRSLLEFLLSWTGFRQIQSGENPMTAWPPPPELQNVPRLLQDLPHWRGVPPLVREARPMPEERDLSLPRRMARSLRRRLAQYRNAGRRKRQAVAPGCETQEWTPRCPIGKTAPMWGLAFSQPPAFSRRSSFCRRKTPGRSPAAS